MLIVYRALLGVAGATLMPSTLALLRSTFNDTAERSFAIGVWSAMGAAGAAAGPLFGGALLQYFWWGSVFLVNVPIMALVLLIGLPALRESKTRHRAGWTCSRWCCRWSGSSVWSMRSGETAIRGFEVGYFTAGVIGVVCLTWFVLRQKRLEHPLVDVRLFASAPFTGAVLATLLSVFGLAGALFFFSQYLQFIKGLEPLQAGFVELPATLAALVAALIAGNIMRRFGRGPVVAVGLLAVGLGMGCRARPRLRPVPVLRRAVDPHWSR